MSPLTVALDSNRLTGNAVGKCNIGNRGNRSGYPAVDRGCESPLGRKSDTLTYGYLLSSLYDRNTGGTVVLLHGDYHFRRVYPLEHYLLNKRRAL